LWHGFASTDIRELSRYNELVHAFNFLTDTDLAFATLPKKEGFFLDPPDVDKIFLTPHRPERLLQLGNFVVPLEDPPTVEGWGELRKYLVMMIRRDMGLSNVMITPLFIYFFFSLVAALGSVLWAYFSEPPPGEEWYSHMACPSEANLILLLDLVVQLLYMVTIVYYDTALRRKFHEHEDMLPKRMWQLRHLKQQTSVKRRAKRKELEGAIEMLEVLTNEFRYERLPPNAVTLFFAILSPALASVARVGAKRV
jgi:hypothetical protein